MSEYVYNSKDLAQFELENCCESICDKQYVIDYIEELEKTISELEEELNNLKGK